MSYKKTGRSQKYIQREEAQDQRILRFENENLMCQPQIVEKTKEEVSLWRWRTEIDLYFDGSGETVHRRVLCLRITIILIFLLSTNTTHNALVRRRMTMLRDYNNIHNNDEHSLG